LVTKVELIEFEAEVKAVAKSVLKANGGKESKKGTRALCCRYE
jgi:hypothetical protein